MTTAEKIKKHRSPANSLSKKTTINQQPGKQP